MTALIRSGFWGIGYGSKLDKTGLGLALIRTRLGWPAASFGLRNTIAPDAPRAISARGRTCRQFTA